MKSSLTNSKTCAMAGENDPLCSDCRQIDWNDIVQNPLDPLFARTQSGERKIAPEMVIADFKAEAIDKVGRAIQIMKKSHTDLKFSSCRCCRILSIIKEQQGDEEKEIVARRLEVTTLGSHVKFEPQELKQGNIALLQIGDFTMFDEKTGMGSGHSRGSECIALFGPGVVTEKHRIPPFINDFAWIRRSIVECSQHHTGCQNAGSGNVSKLLLIDCSEETSTLSIVPAPESYQYAALSYVWGDANTINTEVASVIQDAIKVTMKLGLKFLWVDRYVS